LRARISSRGHVRSTRFLFAFDDIIYDVELLCVLCRLVVSFDRTASAPSSVATSSIQYGNASLGFAFSLANHYRSHCFDAIRIGWLLSTTLMSVRHLHAQQEQVCHRLRVCVSLPHALTMVSSHNLFVAHRLRLVLSRSHGVRPVCNSCGLCCALSAAAARARIDAAHAAPARPGPRTH
jgi:hypothetical protein